MNVRGEQVLKKGVSGRKGAAEGQNELARGRERFLISPK
jgi:hypothetical protein